MRIIILNILTTGLLLLAADLCYAQTWLPVDVGVSCNDGAYIWDINISDDNSKLYMAGKFNEDGACNPMIATLSYDGNEYSQLAQPMTGGESTIAFDYDGKTYCSGYLFSQGANPTNYFNYKDESGNWDTIPNGIKGTLMDYHIKDNTVYLAGALSYCGGVPCGLVCTFDGEQVQPYYQPNGPHTQYTHGVTFYQDTLFVAGTINSQNSTEAFNGYSNLMKVVDGQLEKVAQGFTMQGMGVAVEVLDEKLYVSGWLQTTDNSQFHSVLYYQNGQLHTLPEEPNDLIFAMTTYQDALYVAGGFTQIGNMPCNNVARWDGQEWTCLTSEPFERAVTNGLDTIAVHFCSGQCIKDILVWNDTLYIAGTFNLYGETVTKRIAKLDMKLSEAFPVKVAEQQRQELKLHVFPNPAQEQLTITLPLGARPQDVLSVYDMHGRLVQEQRAGKYAGNITVDVSRLTGGMYVVKYSGREWVLVEQFVKL
jgi:hypothetical protein